MSQCDPARDREAILRMAGTFRVSFTFEETVALRNGYELAEPYTAEADEVVVVLEDRPQKVVLQHILLIPNGDEPSIPLKHWRQDWVFEDDEVLEFTGRRVWRRRKLARAEIACTWTQSVYQVDDGPRYESLGRFIHDGHDDAIATWTSAETWRPLPRREYSRRDDYDVLIAVNRHVIGPDGWRHEQDNRKWVLGAADVEAGALVEERGLNVYARTELRDESVALEYMEAYGDVWRDVRREWALQLGQGDEVRVRDKVDGAALYLRFFGKEDELAASRRRTRRRYIADILSRYVSDLPESDGADSAGE